MQGIDLTTCTRLNAVLQEKRIVEFLTHLNAMYQFEADLPARLAEGRKDPAVLAAMARELAQMRVLLDNLPVPTSVM